LTLNRTPLEVQRMWNDPKTINGGAKISCTAIR